MAQSKIHPLLTVGLDFDDTLWHTTPYFADGRRLVRSLLRGVVSQEEFEVVRDQLEFDRIEKYGYGFTSFVLACLEAASSAGAGDLPIQHFEPLFDWLQHIREKPVDLLPDVLDVVPRLSESYRLMGVTRGSNMQQLDLFLRSGLGEYFSEVEVVGSKTMSTYESLLRRYSIAAPEFVMVGDSLSADIIPVVTLGGYAIHIPYDKGWDIDESPDDAETEVALQSGRWFTVSNLAEVPQVVSEIAVRIEG